MNMYCEKLCGNIEHLKLLTLLDLDCACVKNCKIIKKQTHLYYLYVHTHLNTHRWVCWQTRWKLRGWRSAIWRVLWWSISTNSTPQRRCCSRYTALLTSLHGDLRQNISLYPGLSEHFECYWIKVRKLWLSLRDFQAFYIISCPHCYSS